MDHTRRQFLGIVASSLALAGCVGGDSGDDGEDTEQPTDDESGPDDGETDGGNETEVQVVDTESQGEVLAGPEGLTLYVFDNDGQGAEASACTGSCTDNWPPLTTDGEVMAASGVDTELTTFEREDGSTQVAADGRPLYYWANDETEGDTNGHGVNDAWWVVGPDGGPKRPAEDGSDGDGSDGDGSDGGDGPAY